MITGIIDRFEGNKAVILLEDNKQEVIIDKGELPKGSKENTVLLLNKSDGGEFKIHSIDTASTNAKAQKSSDLMAKLRSKK